jgi:4-amino-4-deoxy-L-arabinose transferase-like glycosyltransferase
LSEERLSMLFLVVALLLLGILVGAVAYLPWPAAVVLGAGILLWLLVFTTRERKRRNARRA